jgi:hypothetical protein
VSWLLLLNDPDQHGIRRARLAATSVYPARMQEQVQLTEAPLVQTDADRADPAALMRTCANCGSTMEERKCKLICHGCGYFLSCSDYY